MKQYKVTGSTYCIVTVIVEAENEDDAIEIADEKFSGITSFCGNGGVDKLIGVSGDDESIYCDGEMEWSEAEEDE
jgi:hypothetical protein